MENRERFMTALRLGQPDRVPMVDEFNEQSVVKLGRHFGRDTPRLVNPLEYSADEAAEVFDLTLDLVEDLDLDAIPVPQALGMARIEGRDLAADRFGSTYRLTDHGEPFPADGPIQSPADLASLHLEPQMADVEGVTIARRRLPGRAVGYATRGPFDLSWTLMGSMEKYLLQLVLDPAFCLALGHAVTDFLVGDLELALGLGAEFVIVEGDLASQLNSLISPSHYRRFVQPFHVEIVAAAHARGVPVIKHSDGNLWPLLEGLLEAGFDGINPIQPQCMDIAEAKSYLAGRACVIGNIDCVELLPFGSEEEVVASVRDTITRAASGGGYILSSSNSIHPGCKPENVVAMFEAAHEYGAYSIGD